MESLDNEVLKEVLEIKNRDGFVSDILSNGYCFENGNFKGTISVANPSKDYPIFDGVVRSPMQLAHLWGEDSDLHLFNIGVEGLKKYHDNLVAIAEKY